MVKKRRVFKEKIYTENTDRFMRLDTKGGYLIIALNSAYADGRNSIVNFYVDDDYRRKGIGTALIEAAKRRLNQISGQCSNQGSTILLYKAGFKVLGKPNLTLNQAIQEFDKIYSICMNWKR